jgi:hypothetical protein
MQRHWLGILSQGGWVANWIDGTPSGGFYLLATGGLVIGRITVLVHVALQELLRARKRAT